MTANRSLPALRVPLLLGVIVFAALLIRLPGLFTRPFHTDEANNAYLLQDLFAGTYEYRGNDHHGPLLFYVTSALTAPFGVRTVGQMEAWHLRAVSLLASLGLAAVTWSFGKQLGKTGAGASAALLLLAAPFAYYGDLFLHETLLLALVAGFVAVTWRLRATGDVKTAVYAGLLAGLALATKETAAVLLGTFVIFAAPGTKHFLRSAAVALGVCVAVVWLLFSHFGAQPAHGWDLFKAVAPQIDRGTGNEHVYPWNTYWLWHFAGTPLGIPWGAWLLGGLGVAGLWLGRAERFAKVLALWTVCLVVLFTALPYKTPWLALSWFLPLAWLGGYALEKALGLAKPLPWLVAFVALLLAGSETWTRCVTHQVDPENPLAYSPSSTDLDRLTIDLEILAAVLPEKHETLVQVVAKDYWPLPWTLRHFPQTGFWSNMTELDPRAIVLAGPEYAERLSAAGLNPQPYALRPGVFIYLCAPKH